MVALLVPGAPDGIAHIAFLYQTKEMFSVSVTLYNKDQHPAGFIGLRVVRTINKKLFQQYFNFKAGDGLLVSDEKQNELWVQAKALDEKWHQESKAVQYQRRLSKTSHKTKAGRGLGFTGITICFDVDVKNDTEHYYPSFRVARKNAFDSDQVVRISKYGFSHAWKIAVDKWAEIQGIADEDKERIFAAPPTPDVFKQLRRQMNKEGKNIPPEALRSVYGEQRESLKKQAPLEESSLESSLKDEIALFLKKRANGTIRF